MIEKEKKAISKSKKIQIIIASLLSAFLIITVPSYHAPLKQMTV